MRRTLALIAGTAILLAGCGSSSSSSASAKASGKYGDKPTITFNGAAPKTLTTQVLTKGTGPVVAKGDLLVADYLGQIWGGKVFDNSYDRGVPAGFPIGVGAVVPGWDKTLVGVTAGSRLLVSLPPADAYGATGNTNAGIKGTDTIVFVVDVISSFSSKVGGDPNATLQKLPAGVPTVTGALGVKPTISIPKGLKSPTKQRLIAIALGMGALIKSGEIVFQYEAIDWTGKADGSTWASGQPTTAAVGATGAPSVLDGLVGLPIGSRVMIEVPAATGQAAAVAIVDVVAQPLSAKATAAGK